MPPRKIAMNKPIAVYAISKHGQLLGKKIMAILKDRNSADDCGGIEDRFFDLNSHLNFNNEPRPGNDLQSNKESLSDKESQYDKESQTDNNSQSVTLKNLMALNFHSYRCHVFLVSIGIVVRLIAPLIQNKKTDPAVICIDEKGQNVIPILSGHHGGANEMATIISAGLSSQGLTSNPVITTASDVSGKLSIDMLGKKRGWIIEDPKCQLTKVSAEVVNDKNVFIYQESGENLLQDPEILKKFSSLVLISNKEDIERRFDLSQKKIIIYRPTNLILGIGLDRDFPSEVMEKNILDTLKNNNLSVKSVAGIATIELKKDEEAIKYLARKYNWQLYIYSASELDNVKEVVNPSKQVKKVVGTHSVSEAAAILAAQEISALSNQQVAYQTSDLTVHQVDCQLDRPTNYQGCLIITKMKFLDSASKKNMTLAIAEKKERKEAKELPTKKARTVLFPLIPINILPKAFKIMVIGGGVAANIKIKTITNLFNSAPSLLYGRPKLSKLPITCYSLDFSEYVLHHPQLESEKIIYKDFYQMEIEELYNFDMIYITIPYPASSLFNEINFKNKINKLKEKGKLVSVVSRPEMGNFINPCTRLNEKFIVSVSTFGRDPSLARELAERFIN